MRKKQYKIKRYKNIYGPNSGSRKPIKVILIIAAIVLCCFLGWALYMPVYNMIMNEENNKPEDSSEIVSPSDASEEKSEENGNINYENEKKTNVKDNSITDDRTASQADSSEKESSVKSDLNGAFVPASVLGDPVQLNTFLKDIKEKGCTSAVVEAKNAMGEVLFLSENETAIKSSAIVANAFDAKSVAKAIKDNGLVPVAKIHSMRDGICAMANNSMACKYYDTQYIWLDNSPELGGRGWLNPYSDEAVSYIGSLACELADAGFKNIIVDSMHYPLGVGREKIGFGNVTEDKLTALSKAMDKISSMVKSKECRIDFVVSAKTYAEDKDMAYGGDILSLKNNSYMLLASSEEADVLKSAASSLKNSKAGLIAKINSSDNSSVYMTDIKARLDDISSIDTGRIFVNNMQGIY